MVREKYGYAESSDIKATNAGHLYHIMNDQVAIENGTLWKKGEVLMHDTQNEEVYKAEVPAVGDKLILALSVLMAYDTSTTLGQHEMFLRKEAGEIARAYELVEGDRYAIADYMITPLTEGKVPTKKNLLVWDAATGKYKEIAASGDVSTYGFVARVNNVEYKSNLTIVRIEVLKNETVA